VDLNFPLFFSKVTTNKMMRFANAIRSSNELSSNKFIFPCIPWQIFLFFAPLCDQFAGKPAPTDIASILWDSSRSDPYFSAR
jgi:hypothetical protein